MKNRVGDVKRKVTKTPEFFPEERLIMVAGNYGSGKTEVAVNLAMALAGGGLEVSIADLDIVNPYFRCREARDLMEKWGIRVVVPPKSMTWADLPIVVPEIRGMLDPEPEHANIFDVGGDDVGAKLLSSLVESLGDKPYELWQVINSRRPFTETVEGCLKMRAEIEHASRLKMTGLVANSHLIGETTPAVILEGYRLAKQVSERAGIPLRCFTAMEGLADAPELAEIEVPLLRLERRMLPPWLKTGEERAEGKSVPEPKVKPIGRP